MIQAAKKENQTKRKIMNTAERLLWRKGFDGASLNDVVKRAGVSKGAFFHYYPNKQAMMLEIINKYAAEQLFAPLDKHLTSAKSVKAGLFNWMQDGFQGCESNRFKGGCMLGNFAIELSDKDESLREHIKQLFLQWENQLVGYLKPAYETGSLLMEPRQFARLLIATYQGVMMTAKVHKDKNRASREFQAMAEVIERMIKD